MTRLQQLLGTGAPQASMPGSKVTIPRKEKKPITSVTVVSRIEMPLRVLTKFSRVIGKGSGHACHNHRDHHD